MQLVCVYACSVQCVKNVLQSIIVLFFTIHIVSGYKLTRDLPGVAKVITFFTTLFTKRKLSFWTNALYRKFYNMIVIVKTLQQAMAMV